MNMSLELLFVEVSTKENIQETFREHSVGVHGHFTNAPSGIVAVVCR